MAVLDLPLIWAAIVCFAVLAYVVLDGFDLGIGILFAVVSDEEARSEAMNAIAPVWDGNETWLVLGGGGLLAAFPLAYALILPATYPLIIVMLLGLVFRGVAFEFRWRDPARRRLWESAFAGGSLAAALAQGMILGTLLQGIAVNGHTYSGSVLDAFTPFSLLTGVSLVAGYALLGSTWLIWRTEGALQARARQLARTLAFILPAAMLCVGAATPFLPQDYAHRWFQLPGIVITSCLALLTLAAAVALFRSLHPRAERLPFFMALALMMLGYAGLLFSVYPYCVPGVLTFREAAAPPQSLGFMLIGAAVIIPAILGYTAWSYWVFRGKVRSGTLA